VREVARRDKNARFTALLHHVTVARLRTAYRAIRPQAAPGVDGVTWEAYGQDLEANLQDLHHRVHSGSYRARPSRRAYIPKADGRQRPLGIASLEDKIVQRAVVEVLNAIYEVDFLGFSYGFRPGRKPHDALDALVLAAALFAHESAAFGVHVPAGLDVDLLLLWLAGRLAARRVVVSLAARGGAVPGWRQAGWPPVWLGSLNRWASAAMASSSRALMRACWSAARRARNSATARRCSAWAASWRSRAAAAGLMRAAGCPALTG
jgi:hypothetical protein